jgi:hypothetical protein
MRPLRGRSVFTKPPRAPNSRIRWLTTIAVCLKLAIRCRAVCKLRKEAVTCPGWLRAHHLPLALLLTVLSHPAARAGLFVRVFDLCLVASRVSVIKVDLLNR